MQDTDMRALSHHPAEVLRTTTARILAVVLAAVTAAIVWAWWVQYEQRALLALPASERMRIYERNLESMRVLCGGLKTPDAFESRCREQAIFLSEFPECDGRCRALVGPFLPKPTR